MTSLIKAIQRLRDHLDGDQSCDDALDAIHASSRGATSDELNDGLRALVPEQESPVRLCGLLSVASAVLVSRGADPGVGAEPVFDALTKGLQCLNAAGPELAAWMNESDGQSSPKVDARLEPLTVEQEEWLAALPLHVIGAMIRLGRSVELRKV